MDASTHTIAALSTPAGRGALAVIRLTGDGAQEIFAGIIGEKERFRKTPARVIGLYTIVDKYDIHGNNDSTVGSATCRPQSINSNDISQNADSASENANNTSQNADNAPEIIDIAPPIIDEVTAVKYDAPRSFTGEEMVEVFCHGGDVIPQKILDRLFRQGARAAGRGEFSRRAFVNGKIGLLKAESIAGLIDSQTETRLKSAQLAYRGKQYELLENLKRRIIAALSDMESRIEFGEDDDVAEAGLIPANRYELESIVAELEEELRRGERVRVFDDGITVALAGPANAGKSSLFNEILGYGRSIVHDRPGTTRDVVSERIIFEGVTIKLIDSAGIRDTDDTVERRGIERTRAAVEGAQAVIWVTSADEPLGNGERAEILEITDVEADMEADTKNELFIDTVIMPENRDMKGTRPLTRPALTNDLCGQNVKINLFISPLGKITDLKQNYCNKKNVLIVINKIDIATPAATEKKRFCEEHSLKLVETSLTEKINRENLFDAIGVAVREVTNEIPVPEIIVNERHRGIVAAIVRDLRDCLTNFEREEVAAHYLKTALDRLEEFSGHVAGDEVLDGIFEKFCIGK